MSVPRQVGLLMSLTIVALVSGCITAAVAGTGMATKVVGNTVNDADVKKKQDVLLGRPVAEAERMFGRPMETLVDQQVAGRELLVWGVDAKTRYVVEARHDKITALSKKIINRGMVSDRIRKSGLEKKVIGFTPRECEKQASLDAPTSILASRETGTVLRVYEVTGKLDLGAKYIVLRFGPDDRCQEAGLVEVSATTKS